MIEIQCTSCHTRYRIDERVLPDDTPTFKCSRCGHVFNADPVPAKVRKPAPEAAESEPQQPRTIRPARPRPSDLKSPVESDVVKRTDARTDARPSGAPKPEVRAQRSEPEQPEPAKRPTPPAAPAPPPRPAPAAAAPPQRPAPAAASPAQPEDRKQKSRPEPKEQESDDPLNRTFGDRDQKADTGENLRFDFSDERAQSADAPTTDDELERPEPHDGGWQVGETPEDFEHAPKRQAPSMMTEDEPAPRPKPTPRRMAAPLEAELPRFATPPTQPKSSAFQMGRAEDDDSAESAFTGATHSSGAFLALFFFVAIAFLGASALICGEPAASARILGAAPQIGGYFARPIVPAMLVALHDVHSQYYALKGGHTALVISGTAQNVGPRPLHLVAIDADLIGASPRPVASQSVFCGNELSAKMLGEMTPREIEFSQGLSPPRTFALEPASSAPFLMVFIDPPTGAGKIRISVSKAEASLSPPPPA
jgi:predicted Zn finger-like uncharacterized protein